MSERFRWRTNPAVIAQYYTGEDVPKDLDVHLKPNEACVVIENGSIVGVATSTRLTVNPTLGTLSRLLSRKDPFRSFLFVHTGPHQLLVKLDGSWADGSSGKGIAGLKMNFDDEQLGRLLTFPSKGITTITAGDLVNEIELEIKQQFASAYMSAYHPSSATGDRDIAALLEGGIRNIANPAIVDLGGVLERIWLSWATSDNDRVMAMRAELEVLAEEGRLISEKDRIEMQRIIDAEINQLESKHQLFIAGKEYEAKADAASDIARYRVKAEKEKEQWNVMMARARLEEQFKSAETQFERKTEIEDLEHTMDIDELRRIKKERELEWIREQELVGKKHQNDLIKDTFDSMGD
jgi:hypothetical protein